MGQGNRKQENEMGFINVLAACSDHVHAHTRPTIYPCQAKAVKQELRGTFVFPPS